LKLEWIGSKEDYVEMAKFIGKETRKVL
jgi:hypothetical protein